MSSSNIQDPIDEVDVCQRGGADQKAHRASDEGADMCPSRTLRSCDRKIALGSQPAGNRGFLMLRPTVSQLEHESESSAVQPAPIFRSRANAAEQTTYQTQRRNACLDLRPSMRSTDASLALYTRPGRRASGVS